MSNNDYREGFKDGFAIGLEEGKRHQNLNAVPQYPQYTNYPIYYGLPNVVTGPNTCYTTGPMGAVGSANIPEYPKGVNGPNAPIDYSMR